MSPFNPTLDECDAMTIQKSEEPNQVEYVTENEETPVWVVVLAAVLVSIVLGFCCYYLLNAG